MNTSILIYGLNTPTPGELIMLAQHFGVNNVITGWKHTDKFPRVDTLVVTQARPASFAKRDPRVWSIEDAKVRAGL